MILPLQGVSRAKSLEVSMVFALWLVLGLPSAVKRGSEEKESGDWGQEEERGQGQRVGSSGSLRAATATMKLASVKLSLGISKRSKSGM